MSFLHKKDMWYNTPPPLYLKILSGLFRAVVYIRRWLYRLGYKKSTLLPVPVIIVGNITVGGTGKTPLVIWLTQFLKQQGFKPGIVSRGYGGKGGHYPQHVNQESDPARVGDEPVLLARRTNCPIVVAPNRVMAAKTLLEHYPCNILISDDGLQHYSLKRDIEIAVLDGSRRFGNGFCLPAGPLREPIERLNEVDFIVTNGIPNKGEYGMELLPADVINLAEPNLTQSLHAFHCQTVHAVAGIGNPERFFQMLREFGLSLIEHPFPDHHAFQSSDIEFDDDAIVMMTEKDAVKCQPFSQKKHWYLRVDATLPEAFSQALLSLCAEESTQI